MRLFFVADGPRDEATIPRIVQRILGREIEAKFVPWKGIRLHKRPSRGYSAKLRYALRQSRFEDFEGVVATVDKDKGKDRLKFLKEARNDDRSNVALPNIMPAAIGEATPHLEAWLLDDPKAVREVLGLPASTEIPNAHRGDPKSKLDELIDVSDRPERSVELLGEIAAAVNIARCNHAPGTGLKAFAEDVEQELHDVDS